MKRLNRKCNHCATSFNFMKHDVKKIVNKWEKIRRNYTGEVIEGAGWFSKGTKYNLYEDYSDHLTTTSRVITCPACNKKNYLKETNSKVLRSEKIGEGKARHISIYRWC